MSRPCLDCGTLCTATRCADCRRQRERARNTARGDRYGTDHRRTRAQWLPYVLAGVVDCWRCGTRIYPDDAWDLGHRDNAPSHPEHATCNRSAGGRAATR